MKKYIFIVGLLANTFAYAQIQVQSTPNVSIDQQNPFLDASKYNTFNNSIGKGLYFPTTDLKTWEFKTDLVNPGNFSTYFDGMIVYNTGEGAPTTEANKGGIRKNLTRGFYYFKNPNQTFPNGSVANGEWVRLSDANAYDQLWAQRVKDGITETYLKPADANGDFLGYKSNKKFSLKLGDSQGIDFSYQYPTGEQGYLPNSVPYSTIITSDALPATNTLNGISTNGNTFMFHNMNTVLKESHVSQNPQARYVASENRTLIKDVTSPISSSIGVNSSIDLFSNTSIHSITGFNGGTSVGSKNGNYNATAKYNTAARVLARNHGHSENMFGLSAYTYNYGTADKVYGLYSSVATQNVEDGNFFTPHSVQEIGGVKTIVKVAENGTLQNRADGIVSSVILEKNSKVGNNALLRGVSSYIYTKENSEALSSASVINNAAIYYGSPNANISKYVSFGTYENLEANSSVTDLVGFQYGIGVIDPSANIINQYGVYINDVDKGSAKNYAIYTNKGNVRLGDLAGTGTRNVVVDENGILKTGEAGATQLGGTENIECNEANRGKMNFQKDVAIGSEKGDTFGICLKGTDGNFYWRYLYGAGGVTNNTGVFGTGL